VAVDQYQAEGTVLFETVRPSLIIDGVYASRDIGLIQTWKNGAVKDGRSLLRWALSFVDRSSLTDQMRVVSELHAKKLSPSATLFEMSEHFLGLYRQGPSALPRRKAPDIGLWVYTQRFSWFESTAHPETLRDYRSKPTIIQLVNHIRT